MDPVARQRALAKTMGEGINCLALFLCGPALEGCRADAADLLRQFAAEYAAAFRQLGPSRSAERTAFLAALDRLVAMARTGVDLDASPQLAALRRAIREVLTALGMALPAVPPAEATICELHGASCPVRARAP